MTAMRFTTGYRLLATFQAWREAASYLAPVRRAMATLQGKVWGAAACLAPVEQVPSGFLLPQRRAQQRLSPESPNPP
jgi:hypothetical protein